MTSNKVHFVSLADNFTVQFSNLLKLPSGMENKQLNRADKYRELRETGPWPYATFELPFAAVSKRLPVQKVSNENEHAGETRFSL